MADPGRDLSSELFATDTPSPGKDLSGDLFGSEPGGWQPTKYGFDVKPIDLGNGGTSVQRKDGAVYFGPDQGNKGKPGWFDSNGNRMGDAPGKGLSFTDATLNQMHQSNQYGQQHPILSNFVTPQMAGMAQGLIDTASLPSNLAAHAVGSATGNPEIGRTADQAVNALEQNYQTYATSPAGRIVGQAMPFLATAGASAVPAMASNVSKVKAALEALKTVGKAAGTGAVVAPAMTADTNTQNDDEYWAAKKKEALLGAAIGGGMSGIGSAIGGIANRASKPLSAEAQAIQDLGDKFGVRTLAPDLTANTPGLNKAAVLAESVPGSGMVGQRIAQQGEARAAAQKLLDQHGVEGDVSQLIQGGLGNKLAQGKAASTAAYNKVAELADGLGDVPLDNTLKAIQNAKAAEESAGIPDQGLIGLLKKMGDRVEAARESSGLIKDANGNPLRVYHRTNADFETFNDVPTYFTTSKNYGGNQLSRTIESNLSMSKPFHTENEALVERIGNDPELIADLKAKGFDGVIYSKKGDLTRGPSGWGDDHPQFVVFGNKQIRPISGEVEPGIDLSYTGVRGIRSDLGSMISDYYKGTNAATGSKGVNVLQGIKGAVEEDLSKFANSNGPELEAAAKRADSIYRNQVVPFKDQMLAKAVKTSEPDQIYQTFIQQGKGDRAQKFYNALDPDGQAAVRSQMVQNAMDAATKKDGVFSPAEFAASLEKIKDATGVFFKGQDKFELDGFTNLMRHVQRAGQVNENPTNGQRAVIALIGGEGIGATGAALMGHPAALVAPAASVGAARIMTKMFASPAGKRFLLSASEATPGSAQMDNLITKQLPRIMAIQSGSSTNVIPMKIPTAAQANTPEQP